MDRLPRIGAGEARRHPWQRHGYMRLPHDYQYEDGEPFDVIPAYTLFGDMPKLNYTVTKEQLDETKHKNLGPTLIPGKLWPAG